MFAELLGLGGSKPKVPAFVPVELDKEQSKSVAGNASVLPEAEKLAKDTNAFNQAQLNAQLDSVLPGARASAANAQSIIADQLMGNVSKDVQDQIQNQTAARSLSGGYGSSGAGNNALARNLGLTSFDIQQRGMDNATKWLQAGTQFLQAPRYDVSSSFVTPMQQAQFDVNERNSKWNVDWLKAQNDAAPAPWERALGGLLDFGVGAVGGGFLGKIGRNMAGNIGSGLFGGGGGGGSSIGFGDTGEMPYSGNLSDPFNFEAKGFNGSAPQGWDTTGDFSAYA